MLAQTKENVKSTDEIREYTQRVKDAATTLEIFKRFDFHLNGIEKKGKETRLLGNGGLLINDSGEWWAYAAETGGHNVQAWYYGKHKKAMPKGEWWNTLTDMGDTFGIERPELSEEAKAAHDERRSIEVILRLAADYYHEQLPDEQRDWLHKRYGLTDETICALKLGYAPPGKNNLFAHLRKTHKIAEMDLLKTGLFNQSEYGVQDTFQGRIMFPYWNRGAVVYFIGRETDASPKWEKEAGGMKYKKLMVHNEKHPYVSEQVRNDWFYGEDAIRGQDTIFITEGVTDRIIANQAGFACVSPVTITFRAADHPKLVELTKHASTVYIINDNERNEAGKKGALATATSLWAAGKQVRFVELPKPDGVDKVDLNDFLREHGADALSKLLPAAKTLLDISIETASKADVGESKANALRDVFRLIAQIDDNFVRSQWRKIVCDTLQVTAKDYDAFLKKTLADKERASAPQTAPEHVNTWPYSITKGRLTLHTDERGDDGETTTADIPLADFWAKITGENTTEYGIRTFVISGEGLRGGAFSFEIAADDYGAGGKLPAALEGAVGAFDPIHVGQAAHMCAAIKKLTNGELARTKIYERTGWADAKFLMPGREPTGVGIRLPRKLPFGFTPQADIAQGLRCMEALIEFMGAENGTILFSTLFLAPLAYPAGWRNERHALFVRGPTGAFKTAATQVAMCLYGPDFIKDEMLLKFGEGATRNGIMSYATQASDIPLLIDNYKPSTGGGAHDFTNLIHNIIEGGEKERLNRSSKLIETKPIFAWPVCTGEDVPTNDPASLARMLILTVGKNREAFIDKLTLAQDLAKHLCAVGQAWLSWLESEEGCAVAQAIGAQMPAVRKGIADTLRVSHPNSVNRSRIATNLATNKLAWIAVCEHPVIGAFAQKFLAQHQTGINRIANEIAGYTANSLEAVRFLNSLREGIAGGRSILLNTRAPIDDAARNADRVIGWKADDNGAYLLPELAIELVRKYSGDELGGVSRNALYEQLDQLGMIASKGIGQKTKNIKVAGKAQRVLHLASKALTPDADGTEAEADGAEAD